MDFPYNIIKGGTTSLIALTITYPIDIWKINNQSWKIFFKFKKTL